jgi:hypothetical protein
MRNLGYVSATVFIGLMLLLASSYTTVVRAQGLFTEGDYWLYYQTGVYGTATLSGSMNNSYAGMTSQTVSGTTYETYDIVYNSSYTWSGTALGTTRSIEHVYVDQSSENTVIDEYNESDDITFGSGATTSTVHGWTYNRTVYNPPGGTGEWPSSYQVGDSWTITYTVDYTEISYDGTSTTTTSGSLVETTTYDVTKMETITVPAGTFDCVVMEISSPEYSYTRWYSDKVGNDVKIVSGSSSSDSTTAVLRAYSFGGSGTSHVSLVYVGLGAAIAATAAVLVLMLVIRRNRTKPADVQPGIPGRPPESPPFY